MPSLPSDRVLSHVVDVHCHPTDSSSISSESMERLKITVCAMSTMKTDQQRVRDLAHTYPHKVIPCFGYHPWFSHLICTNSSVSKEEHYGTLFLSGAESSHSEVFEKLLGLLPDPMPLDDMLLDLRKSFDMFPSAMLGEVGLDRAFRVPFDYFATPRNMSPFTVPLHHQLVILEAQIDLAVSLRRNVSIHSVKSQLATVDLLAKMQQRHGDHWDAISIDMHSCGLSLESWRDIEKRHRNVFLSLSTATNGKHANHKALIEICSPERLLAESDYHDIDMVSKQTWEILSTIAQVKGWALEEDWDDALEEHNWGTVRKLEENWKRFVKGGHQTYGRRQREPNNK